MAAFLAVPACAAAPLPQPNRMLRLSHSFAPSDPRHAAARRFAAALPGRTGHALGCAVYPDDVLFQPAAALEALAAGQLDLALLPVHRAESALPQLGIGLMPGLVADYESAQVWQRGRPGQVLVRALEAHGVHPLALTWQACGIVSRAGPVVTPATLAGLRVAGGGVALNALLKASGAAASAVLPGDLYDALRTSAIDAAILASCAISARRLAEVAQSVTTAGAGSFLFELDMLLISSRVHDALPDAGRAALATLAASLESELAKNTRKEDAGAGQGSTGAPVAVQSFTAPELELWKKAAQESALPAFAASCASCASLAGTSAS